jgi:hypothetical protein
MVMVTVPTNILMFFFMRESNHPTILEAKTRCLRKDLDWEGLRSQLEIKLPPRQVLTRSLVRSMKLRSIRDSLVVFSACISRAMVHLQITPTEHGYEKECG